jgi:hypothetical protein
MQSSIFTEEEKSDSKLSGQAVWFSVHTLLALGSWLALMAMGYFLNPPAVSQMLILLFSILVPFAVGYVINSVRQDEMATVVWLIGLIWC